MKAKPGKGVIVGNNSICFLIGGYDGYEGYIGGVEI